MVTIISGGQTGVDQAALDAAIRLGLPYGGYLPRGRKTENGPLPARYRLVELDSSRYRVRTEKNVLAADGTVLFSLGPLSGGSALTEALAIRHDRPCLHLDLALIDDRQAASALIHWLRKHRIQRLNVAGPRASGAPELYQRVYDLLLTIPWQEVFHDDCSDDETLP